MTISRVLGSLRFQIAVAISILVLTAVTLMGLLVTYLSRNIVVQERLRLGYSAATMIQRELSRPTPAELAAGPDGLRQLARRTSMDFYDSRYDHSITFYDNKASVVWSSLSQNDWEYARAFIPGGSLVSTSIEQHEMVDPKSDEHVLVFIFPWKVGFSPVGTVLLVQPAIPSGVAFLFSGKLVIAFAAVYAGIVILLGIILLNNTIVRPVDELNRAVKRLMAGERKIEIKAGEDNELGLLGRNFSAMARQLAVNEQRQYEQIEELIQVNEELETARRGLVRSAKLASVGRLAAGVAHEVGNPMAAILGYVDLLRKGGIDEETQQDFLARIETDVARINTIIRGLLDYSRPRKEKVEKVEVNGLIDRTVELLGPQKQFKNILFDFTSHKNPALVSADSHQIQQILVNLFINASQAMNEEGTITIFLERLLFDPSVTYRQNADTFHRGQALISINVIDHGAGIDEPNQLRIFDPFFTTKEPGHGTGLGLSVTDKMIDGFGGTIEVSSHEGEGATFTILLPELQEGEPSE